MCDSQGLFCRMLQNSQFNENSIREFLLAILSVPALIYHLQDMSPDVYTHFIGYRVFSHCLTFLANEEQLQAVAVTLEGNRTLCLLGKSKVCCSTLYRQALWYQFYMECRLQTTLIRPQVKDGNKYPCDVVTRPAEPFILMISAPSCADMNII